MRAATSLAPLKRGSQHGWMDALSQFFPAHYGTHRVAATLHFSEYRLRERGRSCGVLTPAECHQDHGMLKDEYNCVRRSTLGKGNLLWESTGSSADAAMAKVLCMNVQMAL